MCQVKCGLVQLSGLVVFPGIPAVSVLPAEAPRRVRWRQKITASRAVNESSEFASPSIYWTAEPSFQFDFNRLEQEVLNLAFECAGELNGSLYEHGRFKRSALFFAKISRQRHTHIFD